MSRLPGRSLVSTLCSALVVFGLLLSGLPSPLIPAPTFAQSPDAATYRARVTLRYPADETRLAQLGLTLYDRQGDQAVVFATEDQLATLARRGFRPDDVVAVESLAQLAGQSLGAAELAAMAAPDADGDGLTDQEEAWWCTDPNNPNSDSPLPPAPPGRTTPPDGAHVQAILDGITAYGPPFALWPRFSPYFPDGTCPDGDFDAVPDLAERYMIGTSPLRESSDKDKFDDGQELFGVTFCPGAAGACGYGILPRAEDAAWVSANMPAWVLPPGNSPWVAAFPMPEVEIVPSSIKVTAKTTITAGKTISEGEERTYGTAKTTGTSSSVADTVTWNEWQEVAHTTFDSGIDGLVFNDGSELRGQFAWVPVGAVAAVASAVLAVAPFAESAMNIGDRVCQTRAESSGCKQFTSLFGPPLNTGQTINNITNNYIQDNYQTNRCSAVTSGQGTASCGSPSVGAKAPSEQDVITGQDGAVDSQNMAGGQSGTDYYTDESWTLLIRRLYSGSYPSPVPSTTTSRGKEWGGAQTTTTTQYEEQTISESSTDLFSTAWEDATAVDTAYAAELRFTYNIVNNGTEYARQVTSLLFNLYIGNDPNPVTTYVAVGSGGQIASLENLFPGESHTYTSNPIPLTLDQMKAIDEGAPIRVVMEDIAFGQDQAFYQDALNGSVTVAMEDGFADGDETIDTYLIGLWDPSDTLQDVLKRYFPVTEDGDGNLLSISTPEFTTNPPTFNKHALTGSSWWNIYLSEGLDYTGDFKATFARPNTTALIRINSDRDMDGYSDRNEIKLGTDPDDPASHPTPELLAGYTTACGGNDCTVLMSFLNSGNYDAYGVEAIMYSPDGLADITNNTIGGSGRVPAGEQVVLGNRILPPNLTPGWPVSTSKARPFSTGYYSGSVDRTYTFTASASGSIASGTLPFTWSDDQGGSGALSFGSDYQSPLPKDVALGVQIGFQSGSVVDGEHFSVQALTPRDTFQYTRLSPDAAEPVVVVSYNDPQGNHRFILPTADYPAGSRLADGDLQADLKALSGKMLPDPGVDIATTSATQANFILNAPHPISITNSYLFVEYIDSAGNVDREDVFTRTLETGPTVVPLTVDTNAFDPAEYTLLAFMTDSGGNIIDSAARPLAAFWADPLPEATLAAGVWQVGTLGAQSVPDPWDFGTVEAGTLLSAQLTLANTGLGSLRYALTGAGGGVSVEGLPAGALAPTETRVFNLTMDTAGLSSGPFSRTLTLRTSDPQHATFDIHLTGAISGGATPTRGTATAHQVNPFRPWDQYVAVPGPQNLNATLVFSHTIADQAARMHPLYLYTENGQTLKGTGEFGPDFSSGTVSFGVFGDGADGDLVVGPGETELSHAHVPLASDANAGQNAINVLGDVGLAADEEVLIIQMRGPGVGQYEFANITGVTGNLLTLDRSLNNTYTVQGDAQAQAVEVPHYRNVTVQNGGTLTAHGWTNEWDPEWAGGILAFRATGSVVVEEGGSISVEGLGYKGGYEGIQGHSYAGTPTNSRSANYGGGGRGEDSAGSGAAGGGGGGYGGTGEPGWPSHDARLGGDAGQAYGVEDLSRMYLGSGGGSGGNSAGEGGQSGVSGGGIIVIMGRTLTVSGTLDARGKTVVGRPANAGGGGGGSGGSVLIKAQTANLQTNRVSADGGGSGIPLYTEGRGGNGNVGRIHIEYTTLSGSTSRPIADAVQVNFFRLRQLPGGSSVDTELVAPDAISPSATSRYRVQFGQRSTDANQGDHSFSVRLPNRSYSRVGLSALVERAAGSGSDFDFCLDIGDPSACEWTATQPFTGPVRLDTTLTQSLQLAAAVNSYIQSHPTAAPDLLIPIRVNVDTPADVFLFNLAATPGGDVVLRPAGLQILAEGGAAPDNIAEGTPVTLSAVISNTGTYTASRFTTAFYDGDPAASGVLIGARFVEALAPAAATVLTTTWSTTGLLGPHTLFVATDVATDVLELDKANNVLSATAVLRRKADLLPLSVSVPDARHGQTVIATAVISNGGEAHVYSATVALYRGDPISGTLVATTTLDVPAGGSATAALPWTPPAAGPALLSLMADPANAVVEADESNNVISVTVRAGWDALTVDAGGAADSDPVYNAALGYGRLMTGTVTSSCGSGAEKTYRQASSVESLDYRFDNLLPLRRYHLDLTFGLCSGERRVDIFVDGRQAGESTLGLAGPPMTSTTYISTTLQTVSILLDPADSADGSVTLSVRRADGLGGPPVNLVDLHEIRQCYRDSGPGEAPWSETNGCGYDPAVSSDVFDGWGGAPEQTVRFAEAGEVRYKFSGLDPAQAYNVGMTFAEGDGAGRQQEIRLDGTLVQTVTLSAQARRLVVPVPSDARADGEVVLSIRNVNGGSAVVSEVALEEITRRYAGAPLSEVEPPAPPPAPPQVVFSSFGAAWDGDVVGVQWGTTTEINNSSFTLFRSTDTKAWVDVRGEPSRRPCGNYTATAPLTYVFTDTAVIPGVTYYYRIQYSGAGCGLGSAVYLMTAQATGDLEGQVIPLGPAWRLISFRLEPVLPSPPLVLASVAGRFDRVLGEEGVYAVGVAPEYNTLAGMQAGLGYYLRMTDTVGTSALLEGLSVPVTSPIRLHSGWNWIGYLPRTTLPLTDALHSIQGHYRRVLSLEQTYDVRLPGYSTLAQMQPGRGYLLYATSAVSLTYPAPLGGAGADLPVVESALCNDLHPTPFMTLVYGQATLDGRPAPLGARVEVVTPRGEVAGCFIVTTAGRFGLMHVYGEDATAQPPIPGFREGEALAFRVQEKAAQPAQALMWRNDWNVHASVLTARTPGLTVYLPVVTKGR